MTAENNDLMKALLIILPLAGFLLGGGGTYEIGPNLLLYLVLVLTVGTPVLIYYLRSSNR